MTTSIVKPRGNAVHDMLKDMKADFQNRSVITRYEPTLFRGACLSLHPAFVAWRPEVLHQLALRAERRGELDKARKLYRLSSEAFVRERSPLGLARETRDAGMMLARSGEPEAGLRTVQRAVELHQDDRRDARGKRRSEKAERQLRVAEAYELRAKVLAGVYVDVSVDRLVDMVLDGESGDFCLRDQHFLVSFTRRYVGTGIKRSLDLRLIDIAVQSGNVPGTIRSIANVVIGTELIIGGKLLDKVLRKE